jgi:hypothetical protein
VKTRHEAEKPIRETVTAIREAGGSVGYDRGNFNVVRVSLEGSGFGDEDLVHLGNLPELRSVYLHNTRVTDAGLEQLYGLSELRRLDLDGTSVTYAGIEQLRKALPNCEIPWEELAVRSPPD